MTKISIIIPCYNEEENLKRGVLGQLASYFEKQSYEYEVIICNDQSTDQSLSIIEQFLTHHQRFKVLNLSKSGKPGAIWAGLQAAKYPLVLFTDMDQSTPISEIPKLLPYFQQGFDIVIGSRGISREGNNLLRRVGSRVFSFLRNTFLNTHIVDTQCGFKLIKTTLARKIFPHLAVIKNIQNSSSWRVTAYDVELLFIAQKWGYQIKEVVVKWKNQDTSTTKGNANQRYFKESKQMAQEIWHIIINNFFGKYAQKA